MKICFYSPYLGKHFGGGEKYLFDVAEVYQNKGNQVFIAIRENLLVDLVKIKKKYEDFFEMNLDDIHFIKTPIGTATHFLKKFFWTKQFDCLYYETDGSLFFSLAKKNILHIQVPLKLQKRNLLEKLKLLNWKVKNTNSSYTKKVIEKYWGCKINLVHQPMVNISYNLNKKLRKEKIILTVGRFFSHLHCKKQEHLVDFFLELLKKYPKITKGWKLILIGHIEDQKYADMVIKRAKKNPNIEFHFSLKREDLVNFYQKSSIYWHASGYGIDQNIHPERVEHFGISTLEAMAYGCAPIVIKKGGQVEVLGRKLHDLLWETKCECLKKTINLIKSKKMLNDYQEKAILRSKKFNYNSFEKKALDMLK
jgi:glycosyltransferase involved in cell wall biosynthesis